MSLMQVVLSFEELHDVVRGLNKCFGHCDQPPVILGVRTGTGLCAPRHCNTPVPARAKLNAARSLPVREMLSDVGLPAPVELFGFEAFPR